MSVSQSMQKLPRHVQNVSLFTIPFNSDSLIGVRINSATFIAVEELINKFLLQALEIGQRTRVIRKCKGLDVA